MSSIATATHKIPHQCASIPAHASTTVVSIQKNKQQNTVILITFLYFIGVDVLSLVTLLKSCKSLRFAESSLPLWRG